MRSVLISLVVFCLALSASAQFTTVTGTVVDPNSIPYSNGTITATLVSSSTPIFTGSNQPYAPPTQPVGLNPVGSFVMRLADVTALTPGGSTWTFKVCSAGGTVQPGVGTGPVCFTVAGVAIAGASQDITATLHAAAPPLTIPIGGGGGTPAAPNNSLQINNGGAFGSLALAAGQLPVGTSGAPAAQNKWLIDVRDYGVKCDNSTNDTTAMNNALAAAVAVGNTTGLTAHVKLPSGYCVGNFVITQGKGLKIQGAGELTTILKSPNANPALQINGLWYSSFSDMSFQTAVPATNAVLEIDGNYDGVHHQSIQFISFRDILVAGGAAGGLSTYTVAVCRQSGGACQGSSLLFENVGLSGASTAVYYQSGFNALGNQFIGGDIQFYTGDGMYILNGTMDVFGTTFETVNQCTQLINGGYDIHTAGGSFPNHILTGIRSEGWTVFNAPGAKIDVFAQNPAWSGYSSNHGTALNTAIKQTGTDGLNHLYCATTAGTTGVSPPTWPASGTVTDGTVVWTEENYNVVNNATWFDSATSHVDESATINMFPPIWSATPGNGVGQIIGKYTVNTSGQVFNGPFDNLAWKSSQSLLERVINSSGTASLDLYSNNNGSASTSTAAFVSPIPAASVGVLTRGGVVKLYLGDNLYEGTDGGTPTTAQYHFTTTANVDGTFARSSGSENYSSFFAQPTINQTGSASGSATILGIYPVLTATKGTPLLVGVGTAASVGGARTNLFTIDPSGTITTAMTGGPFCVHEIAGALSATAADCGAGSVTGTGTTNVVSKWTSASAQGNSSITDDGSTVSTTEPFSAAAFGTATNCAATGSAANPSIVACGSAAAGAFSCDVAASAGTCQVNTTAVTANSEILVQEVSDEGARLGVTCNTSPSVVPAILMATKSAGSGFTINVATIAVNPACYDYQIVN